MPMFWKYILSPSSGSTWRCWEALKMQSAWRQNPQEQHRRQIPLFELLRYRPIRFSFVPQAYWFNPFSNERSKHVRWSCSKRQACLLYMTIRMSHPCKEEQKRLQQPELNSKHTTGLRSCKSLALWLRIRILPKHSLCPHFNVLYCPVKVEVLMIGRSVVQVLTST